MKHEDWTLARRQRFDAMESEINGESDRAAAIVAAAWVEEALSEALKNSLETHSESWKRLFNGAGPLANFSAKIDLARLLGLTTNAIRSDLHTIREVRNEFAHLITVRDGPTAISFQTPKIRDKCLSLKCVAIEKGEVDARYIFLHACARLNADFDLLSHIEAPSVPRDHVFVEGVDYS